MIAAIGLNPSVDKSVTVRGFEVGKTNRGVVDRIDAGGGKGINVAKVLKRLGTSLSALWGLKAGSKRAFYSRRRRARTAFPYDYVHVPGETRVNLKIHDSRNGNRNRAE